MKSLLGQSHTSTPRCSMPILLFRRAVARSIVSALATSSSATRWTRRRAIGRRSLLTYRRERLPIEAGWVTSGYGPLAAGGVYLQDGQCTYAGPIASFVQAAAQENPFQHGRPTLSEAGLAQVLRVVAERGGQL